MTAHASRLDQKLAPGHVAMAIRQPNTVISIVFLAANGGKHPCQFCLLFLLQEGYID